MSGRAWAGGFVAAAALPVVVAVSLRPTSEPAGEIVTTAGLEGPPFSSATMGPPLPPCDNPHCCRGFVTVHTTEPGPGWEPGDRPFPVRYGCGVCQPDPSCPVEQPVGCNRGAWVDRLPARWVGNHPLEAYLDGTAPVVPPLFSYEPEPAEDDGGGH